MSKNVHAAGIFQPHTGSICRAYGAVLDLIFFFGGTNNTGSFRHIQAQQIHCHSDERQAVPDSHKIRISAIIEP